MPEDNHHTETEHKESLMDRILGHNNHHSRDDADHEAEDSTQHPMGGIREDLKKDDASLKKYLQEDEELEEGQTYGGLM